MESVSLRIYRAGAVCALLVAGVMLAEIGLTALPDGARVPLSAQDHFDLFSRSPFMAMRYLGLINLVASTLLIPVFYALYDLHRRSALAGLALLVFLAGYAIFVSDNVAFPMLALSRKFEAAATVLQKQALLAAAEALLAKGSSHTPGTFPGFLLGQLAWILFSLLMIQGEHFRRRTAAIGIVAALFLLLFEVSSAFIPQLYDPAMILAAIGGLFAISWYVLVGLGLWKLAKREQYAGESAK